MERISRRRAVMLLVFFALILIFFSFRLFKLQIIDETDSISGNITTFVTQTRVKAARGDILDRNGNILIGNRASYDLVFNHFVITSSDDTNGSLYKLINKCKEMGIEYSDHLPISRERPFVYTTDQFTSAWQGYFHSYMVDREMDSDITAPLLIQTLRQRYKIPSEWSDEDARAVIGLRYEFDLRGVVNLANYVFLEDVSDEQLSALLELNIPGLNVEASTVREYYTSYAAHILGTMGAMNEKQWQKVKEAYENGTGAEYYMDAQMGQSGFESAFEDYLHGVDGLRRDEVDKNGTVISSEYYEGKEPRAGNNVETTIDINLQIVAEDALADVIDWLQNPDDDPNKNRETAGRDVEGAAVVVMKVDTGEVLACASYPTYNLQTYNEEYENILKQDYDPLFNRAISATYPPGSSYKMCTLIAAMENGCLAVGETIADGGIYLKYKDDMFTPTCLIYSSQRRMHQTYEDGNGLTPQEALEVSCNYFFYELGDRMFYSKGSPMDDTAKALGLGEPTGIELVEKIGYRSNKATKEALYTGINARYTAASMILGAIGQDENSFSPMQLAVYASTLANQGKRYRATFLNRVVSSDYRSLVYENSPELVSTLEISDSTYKAYLEGMIRVCHGVRGTARETMAGMPVTVAGKTGTAQHGLGKDKSDHGAFICFAPAENPQIAIAVYGEKAAHGSTLARVAAAVIRYYFDANSIETGTIVALENTLG